MPTDITEAIRAADFQALIFDLDGVFVESEPIFFEAFNSILAPYGVSISEDYFCQMVGHSSAKNLADIARDWDIDLPVESFLPKLDEAYMNLVKTRAVHARLGVWPLIYGVKAAGLLLGLCTSSQDHLARLVDRLVGAEHKLPRAPQADRAGDLLGSTAGAGPDA